MSNDAIIDTHQHLWDLSRFTLPWLDSAPRALRQSYGAREYLEATQGLNIRAIYMEVDVAPEQHDDEVQHIVELCRSSDHPTTAAVVGGRPSSPDFPQYVARLKQFPEVKGVRQVLHVESTPAGYCREPEFVRGVQLLGESGLSFDLCMRPGELQDGVRLSEQCPQTRFVIDHCGNADVKWFRSGAGEEARRRIAAWRRNMDALAARPNVICKISGIVATAPPGWKSDDLAPAVNHCLDVFGPDRVVFGSDWPVCLIGAELQEWVTALAEIVGSRPAAHQTRLWRENAATWYGIA
ncbi:MAG: amidohydrolase family protein [Planctomycetes bacterium]|nr:amidohydrolase family protein [Planctomycetota bacterium]